MPLNEKPLFAQPILIGGGSHKAIDLSFETLVPYKQPLLEIDHLTAIFFNKGERIYIRKLEIRG